jgi:hypothetical protein
MGWVEWVEMNVHGGKNDTAVQCTATSNSGIIRV